MKFSYRLLLVHIFVFILSTSLYGSETGPFSLQQAIKEGTRSSQSLYKRNISDDLKLFSDRAGKLQRLCEGSFREGSYLDRLSRKDALKNHEILKPVFRFWNLFRSFLDDLDFISRKYEVPLVFDHNDRVRSYFTGYTLGITARLARVIMVSEFMNFLSRRGGLEDIINEGNRELRIPQGSLRKTVKDALHPENLAHLYRFRISHFDDIKTGNKLASADQQPPVAVTDYLLAHKDFLGNLSHKVASDPSWKFLSRSIINASLDFFLPAQRQIFTWVGDTRVKEKHSRLISADQLEKFAGLLKPGDILVGRQDWYLSNIFLPGFWPHALLYIGTPAEVSKEFDSDPEITNWCKKNDARNFSELLEKHYPKAAKIWKSPNTSDGKTRRIMEAISEGIVLNSIPGALHCDYVAAVRPRLKPMAIARAILLAFSYYGREYDFQFSFNTEQSLVCTELVTKAYSRSDDQGLRFPMVKSLGNYGIPADSIVREFAENRRQADRQLDFIAFVRGLPAQKKAVFA
ncbi:MAG: YiiX/YebB-like N1pC/P60 family cysteine hydrolase, partial [Candidatus Riflebacteria bacterium]|nr:YiiX/YebB-like N1pC/P60 family cysteine hydrolase [Candidatus Riflebacteria bacterium]